MKTILKIFSVFTSQELRYCLLLFVVMVIGAILEAIGIGAILPLISLMGKPDFLLEHPAIAQAAAGMGIYTHIQLIMALAAVLMLVYIAKDLYLAWQVRLQITFAMRQQVRFSRELMANYLSKPYLFHLNHNTATLLRNVNNAGQTIFSGILIPLFQLLTEVVTAVVIWLMLVLTDAFTAVVVAGVMGGLIYALIRSFRRKIAAAGRVSNDYAARYIKAVNQGLGAIKETKIMRKERYFLEAFDDGYTHYGRANRHFLFLNQMPRLIIEAMVVCSLLAPIIGKLALGANPMDIVPLLGVLALAAFRLMPSANRIVNLSNGIKFQLPLFNELYRELLVIKARALHHTHLKIADTPAPLPFQREICVEHLAFSYPGSHETVLRDVGFVIPKGKFVGIVGPSGAGKTTFVDILLGLLRPTGGRITVDGVNIEEHMRAWQGNIAYVPQNIYLVDGTIRENIALGVAPTDIDDREIERVLEMAELKDFVHDQKDGIRTMVGERGVKLSGGQRQRIGIARALYQRPTVLVLDEATSALDNETEKSITATILKFKGKVTIISIAHRLSTLSDCDFKVRFENGGTFYD